MALITALVDILDPDGNSVVPADTDGTKPVKKLKLTGDFSYTYTRSGDVGIVALSVASGAGGNASKTYVDQQLMIAKLTYVQPVGRAHVSGQFTAVLAENRTGASISIPGVRLIPYNDSPITQDPIDYISISLRTRDLDLVSSDAILCTVNTQDGDVNGLNQTLTGGTPLDMKAISGMTTTTGPFVIPTGKAVLVDIMFSGGSAPTCPEFSIVPHT